MAHSTTAQVAPAAAFTFKAGLVCFAASWFLPVIQNGTSGLQAFTKSFGGSGFENQEHASSIVTPLGTIDPHSLALAWFEHAWLANIVVLAVLIHVLLKRKATIGRMLFPISALGALWAASGYAIWHLAGQPFELTPSTGAYLWAGSLVLLAMSGCANRRRYAPSSTTTSSARTRREIWGPSSAFAR